MWELTSSQLFSLLLVKMILQCTLAGDDRGNKTTENDAAMFDQFKTDWFVHFVWLIHDSKSHCKVCVHAKAKNVFVTGKDCAKPKKDDLAKHEISADHRRSTLLPKRQMDFVTANDHAKSAIITGLVNRVDTVTETRDRVVVVDTWGDTCMVTFCVGDLQCDRFSCFIFIIKHCCINLYWCYVFL